MNQNIYSFSSSGAFVETFTLAPYQDGILKGLSFAVKDNIDIAGYKTSYGSKAWEKAHKAAAYNALCIEQLLGAGAICLGKSVSDEFTYSLDGENYFFGTPINPKAPERVPGGSSSGSASAVACGLVDFSIGTDNAGSIRVPASLCGVWGMRPTIHRISEAGVLPFVPSSSTVGVFANNINVLEAVMRTLLRSESVESFPISNIYLLEDAFAIADPGVSECLRQHISQLPKIDGVTIKSIRLSEMLGEDIDLNTCNIKALRILQNVEFMNTVGSWIENNSPQNSPFFSMKYDYVRQLDRKGLNEALLLCEKIFNRISRFIKKGDVFMFPTTPRNAPLKGSLSEQGCAMDFYDRTMAITSFSGIGRLPEISVPVATFDGAPIGLSLAAGCYQDEFLLAAARQLFPLDLN